MAGGPPGPRKNPERGGGGQRGLPRKIPPPRPLTMGGLAEPATPDKPASQETIARPLNDGRSEDAGNSQRTSVAADTQTVSSALPSPAVTSRPDRIWIPDPSLHHIVIVGGGAAGL